MGRLPRIGCDIVLAVLATLSAIVLRTDLTVQWPDLAASAPYLGVTAATATLFVGASGLDHGFWRFASLIDIVKVIGVSLVTTVATVAVVFAYNRLEGVARAVPVMQPVLIAVFLLAPRLLSRTRFTLRKRNPRPVAMPVAAVRTESVLIVGMNSLTEVYLRALLEVGDTRLSVAGIVSARPRHVGRFLRQYRVLGTFDDIGRVVADLAVHGAYVGRVILAVPLPALPVRARQALARLEAEGILLDPLAARLAGALPPSPVPATVDDERPALGAQVAARRAPAQAPAALGPAEFERMAHTPYWRWKRAVDLAGTALAALLLLPVGGVVLVLVTIDLGWPPIFWQDRLGIGGGAFRLYKFRTMAPAHDHRGMPIPEEDRLSSIGALLRRSRLDEIPQLWNVLAGDMALTGPRPLLSIDQPEDAWDRLSVRPGLTGWAQVQGGRKVSNAEKAALDLWWIRNASFGLDLRILVGTLRMMLTGERVNDGALTQARAAREEAGPDAVRPPHPPCGSDRDARRRTSLGAGRGPGEASLTPRGIPGA